MEWYQYTVWDNLNQYGPYFNNYGPSGVCALPLGVTAEQSVHYFCDYFSFLCHIYKCNMTV